MNKEEKDIGKIVEEMLNRPLELIEENKKLKKKIDKLQKENEELKLDSSKLILGKFREVADKNSYIKDMYISKDKIKAKIKELEEEQKREKHISNLFGYANTTKYVNINNEREIKVLNELLGE